MSWFVVQIIPLASQFKDLHEDMNVWLDEAEKEIQEKAVTPDQIRQRQQANKVSDYLYLKYLFVCRCKLRFLHIYLFFYV